MILLLFATLFVVAPDPNLFNEHILGELPRFSILVKSADANYYKPSDYKDKRDQSAKHLLEHSPSWDALALHAMLVNYAANKFGKRKHPLYMLIKKGGRTGIGRGFMEKTGNVASWNASPHIIWASKSSTDTTMYVHSFALVFPMQLQRLMLTLASPDTAFTSPITTQPPLLTSTVHPWLSLREGWAWAAYLWAWEQQPKAKRLWEMKACGFNTKQPPNKWLGFKRFEDSFSSFGLGIYQQSPYLWYPFYKHALAIRGIPTNLFAMQTSLPDFLLKGGQPVDAIQYAWLMPPSIEGKHKGLSQALSSPGVCAYFFYRCMRDSMLMNGYPPAEFYGRFQLTSDKTAASQEIALLFPNYYNVQVKLIAAASARALSREGYGHLRLLVLDYARLFPREASRIIAIYKDATGFNVENKPAKPFWVRSNSVVAGRALYFPSLRMLGSKHTFDLNASNAADLRCITGLKVGEIKQLLTKIRQGNGFVLGTTQLNPLLTKALDTMHSEALKPRKIRGAKPKKILLRIALVFIWHMLIPMAIFVVFLVLADKIAKKPMEENYKKGFSLLHKKYFPLKLLKLLIIGVLGCLIVLLMPFSIFSSFFYMFVSISILQVGIAYIAYHFGKHSYSFRHKVAAICLENVFLVATVYYFL